MLIYTHPQLYQVANVQNLLAIRHIRTSIRNQYAGGAIGELSANDAWVELWLDDERDEALAKRLMADLLSEPQPDWHCPLCQEANPDKFETCWSCQAERA